MKFIMCRTVDCIGTVYICIKLNEKWISLMSSVIFKFKSIDWMRDKKTWEWIWKKL